MEKILNTVSKNEIDNLNNLSSTNGKLTIETNFERNEELNDFGEILELNKISTDQVEILDKRKVKNGIEGIECELLVNHSKDVRFELDIDGSLNITDYNVEKYELNDLGELIMKL